MLDRAATGSAAFVVDARQSISAWNAAMVDATGIPARAAIGRPCHEVMAEVSGGAAGHCRRSCPVMRATSAGWTTPPSRLTVRRGSDVRSAALHTVTLPREPGSILHLLHVGDRVDAPAAGGAEVATRVITARQHEVLALLAEGVAVRGIGERLVLSESTVRNHVRAILRALGVHSMLQAVSEARRRGLI